MNPRLLHDTQELARRFNEDEEVWERFQEKRAVRRLLGSPSPLPEEVLDHLDWLAAEDELRQVRAVGQSFPARSED